MEILEDSIVQYKRDLLRKIIIIMVIIISSMGIMRIYEENYPQAISDFVLSIVSIYSYRRLKDIDEAAFYTLARVVFAFVFITLFILSIYTHANTIQLVWFSTVISLIFFIFDKREGLQWFSAIIATWLIIFYYNSALIEISQRDLFIWIFNMLVILLVISWYEKIKNESTQKLINIQYLLSNEVKKKTFELQELNNSLEQKIKIEIERNREKEKQLLHQSRLAQMGEMISMISHQWRQPLAAISATSASIELKASLNKLDNETAEQKAHDISNFSQHLSRTIDDFRNFFKPNKEKSKITYDEIIKSVLNIVKISITNKNIELHTDLHCHNRFMSYPNELQQVVLNLIKNAEDILLEKMVESPFIKIKTYQKNNTHILEVSDNGGGVPETQKEGTGLGLYMSKMIIEEHCGGKLDIFNSSEGAMFRIKIKNNENS